MKASFLGKLLGRLERVEAGTLESQFLRLAQEKGFLETVFDTLQEAVVVLDSQARVEYHNRSALRLLPFPSGGAEGQPLGRFLRDLDWPTLLRGSDVVQREIRVTYPEARVLQFNLVPLSDSEPETRWFVAIFHDITQWYRQTVETVESERLNALTLLAAGVAHELGNPLNSLNIHLQLMERELRRLDGESAKRLRKSVEIATREIERLDMIINQFLRAVRPTIPQMVRGQVTEVVEASLALLQAELDDRKILVEREWENPVDEVMLDREQLQQAFYNVIKNAMQAMKGAGLLRISVSQNEHWVWVEFIDNGGGIDAKDMPHVLKPYFTTKSKGTGLGLIIVQRIVREHGGELDLESRPGQGLTVRIKLPRRHPQVRLLEGGHHSQDSV